MSLLIEPAQLDAVKACIEENHAEHHDIVPLKGQIKSHRDQYC
jgi:hypothetical protein